MMMLNQTENLDDSCDQIRQTIRILNITIPLIWVVLGTVTNGLSLVVFSRKSMRHNSTFFYLYLMTLSDFIVIWVGSFRDFLAYKFHVYISGTLICRLHVFTFFVSCQLSSWLLTVANLDRFFSVLSFSKSKKWCNRKVASKIFIILFVSLALINAHFLVFLSSEESSDPSALEHNINPIVYPHCKTSPGFYTYFYANYYSWIDSFVFSFVPFFIMLICNIGLVAKVFRSKQNLNRHGLRTAQMRRESSKKSFKDKELDKMRYMALTIIGVTLLFIVFTVPINIYNPIMHAEAVSNPEKKMKKCDDLIFCILNNTVNANHSTSFFIYLTTNSKFKKEIKIMLKRAKHAMFGNFSFVCCGFKLMQSGPPKQAKNLDASITSTLMNTFEYTKEKSTNNKACVLESHEMQKISCGV
ncbi:FMRFamide receptor-like [Brachionus plicatilis]|uniref:FMRFamide receptor-like n=1 Tax=Brachionus plicatilis TaxID=10195 RepID=A0A3M7S9V6_BRAPC|nr:FMRFamide receptor-like [Brachionus plicatilis]